ncbi:hypothetical protein ACJMK2_016465 [Sinanodonta woodiana]|uniref:Leucine rich repeat neuronal 1 n=1 Tax=Sinanodonta woodiana TaxID=1069815 RepID=A0ABD3UUJ5_SINWO
MSFRSSLMMVGCMNCYLILFMALQLTLAVEENSTESGQSTEGRQKNEVNNLTNDGEKQSIVWETKCPESCRCTIDLVPHFKRIMKTVNCSFSDLQIPPRKIPDAAQAFLLSGNKIEKLRKLPHVPNLEYLDLSNNEIEIMDDFYLFSHFKEVKCLLLNNNRLKEIPTGSFSGLLNLDILDLSNNRIKTIYKHAFAGLNHLQTFNFEGNRLSELDPDWFEDMYDVKELILSNNSLTKLDSQVFKSLPELISLKLAQNNIWDIHPNAFEGLKKLTLLDLSNNKLALVPSKQLKMVPNLGMLLLDGNQIYKIQEDAFAFFNITELSLSYMPKLTILENKSFSNLPNLILLQLHDNQELLYIDNHAFYNCPLLKVLYVHNNKLMALPAELQTLLPSLEEIHLYHNPIRCDCNAYWIKEILSKPANETKIIFKDSEKVICESPLNVTGTPVEQVLDTKFSKVCTPTSLPLFHDEYKLDLGEELRLECHALGVPEPQIQWLLPNGSVLNTSVSNGKLEVHNNCTLIVHRVNGSDKGTYSCKSFNSVGFDISSTAVKISDKYIRLVPGPVSDDYISVSWNGSTHPSMITEYRLTYRQVGAKTTGTIHIGQSFQTYAVTRLQPSTTYEFCIIYMYDTESYTIDCINVTTKATSMANAGITKIVDETVIVAVCSILGILLALGCVIALIRKFRNHQDYEQPFDQDESESMTNIPLNSFYQPLNTPLYSSRASLIKPFKAKDNY